MNKADEAFVDALIEENRELRETIRELMRERVASDKHWSEFTLKAMQQVSQETRALYLEDA